ncbi:hypothetical protein I4F81_005350 [Pyropia yezoensis]|uniref:Uncharacterized protein n=1 Tax=Pyropia yezoensis TaxID=2788 RepID=A0ACC3BYU7_PYRYE|nr:hypothetical protein I4F81_005350 [Neopyropia yezoensis]
MVGWASPAGMPAYTCLTPAVVNLLQATPLMRETTRRRDLVGVPVGAWDDSEIHVLGEAVFSSALLAADASASGTEFCAAGFVNDYRPGREVNAQFEQAHDPLMAAEQLLVPGAAHILVLTDVKTGEEIVVDYGSGYCSLWDAWIA